MLGCNHPNATQFATAKLHAMGARYLTSNGRKHSEKEGGGGERNLMLAISNHSMWAQWRRG